MNTDSHIAYRCDISVPHRATETLASLPTCRMFALATLQYRATSRRFQQHVPPWLHCNLQCQCQASLFGCSMIGRPNLPCDPWANVARGRASGSCTVGSFLTTRQHGSRICLHHCAVAVRHCSWIHHANGTNALDAVGRNEQNVPYLVAHSNSSPRLGSRQPPAVGSSLQNVAQPSCRPLLLCRLVAAGGCTQTNSFIQTRHRHKCTSC